MKERRLKLDNEDLVGKRRGVRRGEGGGSESWQRI